MKSILRKWLGSVELPVLVLLLLCCASCSDRPEGVPRQGRMTELLFDYHLAQALAEQVPDSADVLSKIYTEAVLRKHGLTQAQFEESLKYYERHSDKLEKIYTVLDERFSAETGTASQFIAQAGKAKGDTTNIWPDSPFVLLAANGRNHFEFTLPVDTGFRPGDKLEWTFNTHFLYRDGLKRAVAVIYAVYDNDSVAAVRYSFSSSSRQSVHIQLGRMGVKRVEGFVYLESPWNESPRLLALSGIVLQRTRGIAPIEISNTPKPVEDRLPDTASAARPQEAAAPPPPDHKNHFGPLTARERAILDSVRRKEGRDQPHFK